MELLGTQFIGNKTSQESGQKFYGINPKTGESLVGAFTEATEEEVDQAVHAAEEAFIAYRDTSPEARAKFLEQIAEEILALGDTLIERAMAETALPQGRLQGERGRTMNQMKLFAQVVREGSWVDARIETAIPDRQPFPKADIRHMMRPLGPVGVFGASNFPLAFSVAGGDTASALASGCPVVVKGHPAHPGTSELVARAIISAAQKTGMPEGVFSMVQGASHEVGGWLVKHPLIHAIGFTGSFRGGKALFDIANQREVPIPVFAEMGSTNPVFLLPGAMEAHAEHIAKSLAGSINLGVGQFCTNPGLVFLPHNDQTEAFKKELATSISDIEAGTMLTSGIKSAYEKGVNALAGEPNISRLASGKETATTAGVKSEVFLTEIEAFHGKPIWAEEVFGPSSLLIQSSSKEDMMEAAQGLEGHLTATVHGTEEDFKEYADLFSVLERKVGRL
ncbi:MAG: aldehyde dehydrogenase (NADP(+)), partial [Bacteroidota bacterium]